MVWKIASYFYVGQINSYKFSFNYTVKDLQTSCQKPLVQYASCIRDHSPSSSASDFTCPQMSAWFIHEPYCTKRWFCLTPLVKSHTTLSIIDYLYKSTWVNLACFVITHTFFWTCQHSTHSKIDQCKAHLIFELYGMEYREKDACCL